MRFLKMPKAGVAELAQGYTGKIMAQKLSKEPKNVILHTFGVQVMINMRLHEEWQHARVDRSRC